MERQKKSLIKSLVFIVDNLENTDRLAAYLEGMGKRHVRYGTTEEHFPWVGESLLKTFAYFFEKEWTPELNQEWETAIGTIATLMIKGMGQGQIEAPQKPEKPKPEAKVIPIEKQEERSDPPQQASNLSINIDLPDNLKADIKIQVKDLIQSKINQAIENEVQKAIQEELSNISNEAIQEIIKKAV